MRCWNCGAEGARYSNEVTLTNLVNEAKIKREELRDDLIYGNMDCEVMYRCYCRECYDNYIASLNRDREEYGRLKKRLMLERAVRILERQALYIYEYQDIIKDMEEYVAEHPDKFDSAHEIVAAIILAHNEIKMKAQYKIGNYRVDFLIPEMCVVLEIDGNLHKNTLYRDNKRDIAVRQALGPEWEIVRISTDYLEQNAKMLPDAIGMVREEKQKIRRQNYGMLPEWYSERNKAKRNKRTSIGDDKLLDIELS